MATSVKRLTLPLTGEAWARLAERSREQRRTPKLQALYELETALGVTPEKNEAAATFGESTAASQATS